MIGRWTDDELDAQLRTYLAWRADAVAARAVGAVETARVIGRRVGGEAATPSMRALRVAIAIALLLLLLLGAALVGGLFRDRYAPDVPLLDRPLDGQPWAITAAHGAVWVGAYREPVVYRLDPRSGEVLDRVSVVAPVCGGLEAGYGALWLSHCGINALSRVDAATLAVTRLSGHGSDQVALGAGSVWTAHGNAVARLDPLTLQTQTEIDVGGGALVAFAEGSAWAMLTDAGVVRRIDPATDTVSATISWPGVAPGAYPVHAAGGGGALWVVDERALRVYRIDASTNAVTELPLALERFTGTSFGDWFIAYGRDRLWVRQSESLIVEIDPASLAVVGEWRTPTGGGGGFVVTHDALWVGTNRAGSVWGVRLP